MKFKTFLRTPNLRSANDSFWNLLFNLDCPFNNLHVWLKLIHVRLILNTFVYLICSFVCQYFLRYYWYCYNKKQSSGAVLQKRCSYKFRKIHKKTPKKRFQQRWFLVNSAIFLITLFLKKPSDGCFTINTCSLYCPTTTFCLFKNNVTHIFWLSIF